MHDISIDKIEAQVNFDGFHVGKTVHFVVGTWNGIAASEYCNPCP